VATFDPSRCALVEREGSNQVWRGPIPINASGNFAYHEIAVALDLDPGFSLVDVSLIDNIKGGEREQWAVELKAYGVSMSEFPGGKDIPPQFNQKNWNPAQLLGDGVHLVNGTAPGRLVWWQIEGGHDGIVLGPDTKSYNFIGLMEFFEALRLLKDTVVYFHCMNGTDRTGAVVAGYAMRWMGMNLDDAMNLANSVGPAGQMNDDYKKLVEAYASWLEKNPPT
jgi:hypothetical protein